jgi:HAD superfamily hydrolase (TIGR01484 family)
MQSPPPRPLPLSEATRADLSQIRGVCLDIDDTLTTDGKLTADAFAALWSLKDAGFAVVPITGRPAGWCDHFARFWPVDAVVGENGAFTFFMKKTASGELLRARLDTPGALSDVTQRQALLQSLHQKILARFPQANLASDQAYREHDLAVDFCEDVARWPREDIDALVHLCEAQGAHAKVSSIHVNTWFGEFDKTRGFQHWLRTEAAEPLQNEDAWLFIGDSPNDAPMFKHFKNSVGVANVADFLDRISTPPRWITQNRSGLGFVEMTKALLK